MMHKIKTMWRMMRTYKNWVRLMLYRMDILPGETVVNVRDGSRFYIRAREGQEADLYVINESYLYGIHDDMLPYMKNAKVGLDIGAHIGTFSVFAAKHSPAKIYAVEPEDDNAALLKKNIAANALDGRIVHVEAVVSNETGSKELFVFQNRGLNSVFKNHGDSFGSPLAGSKKIQSFNLKDLFQKYNIGFCDFMKVDVEGAEYDIFLNLPQDMYDRIGVIGLEISGKFDRESLASHIRNRGFRVTRPREEFNEYFCVNNKRRDASRSAR